MTGRRLAAVLAAAVVACAVPLAASAQRTQAQSSPKEWTTVMCTSLVQWQKTVQQSYPDQYNNGRGGGPAFSGAFAVDALGFINDPTSHTPQFQSAGDSWYKLSFTGNNPCGAGNPLYLVFTVPNANLQSNYDESWGVDNVAIKTDL